MSSRYHLDHRHQPDPALLWDMACCLAAGRHPGAAPNLVGMHTCRAMFPQGLLYCRIDGASQHFAKVRATNRDGGWPACGPALDQRSCPTNRHDKHTSKRLNPRRLGRGTLFLTRLQPSVGSRGCRSMVTQGGRIGVPVASKETKRDKRLPHWNHVGLGSTGASCNTSGQKVDGWPGRYRFRQNTESLAHVIRGQCRRMARAWLPARP